MYMGTKREARQTHLWLFPGAFVRQMPEGKLESESHWQSSLTSQRVCCFILLPHCVQTCVHLHTLFYNYYIPLGYISRLRSTEAERQSTIPKSVSPSDQLSVFHFSARLRQCSLQFLIFRISAVCTYKHSFFLVNKL